MRMKNHPWLWDKSKKIYIHINSHRKFCSNSIWCSFTLCVDSVIAAAAADFPGLAKWLLVTGRRSGSRDENEKQVCLTLGWSSVVFALCSLQDKKRWQIFNLRWSILILRWWLITYFILVFGLLWSSGKGQARTGKHKANTIELHPKVRQTCS